MAALNTDAFKLEIQARHMTINFATGAIEIETDEPTRNTINELLRQLRTKTKLIPT
jgi:hypothetical protein